MLVVERTRIRCTHLRLFNEVRLGFLEVRHGEGARICLLLLQKWLVKSYLFEVFLFVGIA